MESPHLNDESGKSEDVERGNPPAPEAPPQTSEEPPHEEQVGGKGAQDSDELADEDRYRKGPGW